MAAQGPNPPRAERAGPRDDPAFATARSQAPPTELRRASGGFHPPPGVPLRQPLHPGRFLERHYLEPLGLSQTETARRLGISRRRVNEIVMGHRGITPDTAIRCALAFGWPACNWLALQARWDTHQAWQAWQAQIRGSAGNGGQPAATAPPGPCLPADASDAAVRTEPHRVLA